MRQSIPPLTALRCFEAAARRQSFTLAADELCLTPSAISHRIKTLEEFLRAQLFVRSGRKMLLTDQGASYYKRIHFAFNEIIGATMSLSQPRAPETLRISVAPSFANVWLMPRLAGFIRANQSLPIQVFTNMHPVHFADTAVDCEIRYGHGKWPPLEADLLLRVRIAPLCSPVLLRGQPPPREPKDLLRHTLIYTDSRSITWETWARRFDVPGLEKSHALHVDRSPLALEAAALGLGIALENDVLARRQLEAGVLLAPLGLEGLDNEAYYLVYPKANAELERVRLFRSWIFATLAKDKPSLYPGPRTSKSNGARRLLADSASGT